MKKLILIELLNGNEDEPLSGENGSNVIYNFNMKTKVGEDNKNSDDKKDNPKVTPGAPNVPKDAPKVKPKIIKLDAKPENPGVKLGVNNKGPYQTDNKKTDPIRQIVNANKNMSNSNEVKISKSKDKSKLIKKADKNTNSYVGDVSEISPDKRNDHLTSALLNRHVILIMGVMTLVLGGVAMVVVRKHL